MPTDIPPPLPIAVGHQPTSDARHGHRRNKERKGKGYTPGEGKQKEGGHGFPDRGHTQRQSRKTVVTAVSRGQGRSKEN